MQCLASSAGSCAWGTACGAARPVSRCGVAVTGSCGARSAGRCRRRGGPRATHLGQEQVHRREDDRAVAPPLDRDDGHLALLPKVHDLDEPLGLKPARVVGREPSQRGVVVGVPGWPAGGCWALAGPVSRARGPRSRSAVREGRHFLCRYVPSTHQLNLSHKTVKTMLQPWMNGVE